MMSSISDEMVRLYKEQFGRGPTKARTHWAGSDTLVVLLEDTLVPAERNLAKMGEHQRVATFACSSSTPPCASSVNRSSG